MDEPQRVVHTFDDVITTSLGLAAPALLCVVLGSVRSARLVRRTVEDGWKMTTSITMKEARWMPISGSALLIFIYCLVNHDKITWSNLEAYLTPDINHSHHSSLIATHHTTHQNRSTTTTEDLPLIREPGTLVKLLNSSLLAILCFFGSAALATLLKPAFSFLARFLPFGLGEIPPEDIDHEDLDDEDDEDIDFEDTGIMERLEDVWYEWDRHDTLTYACCSLVGITHFFTTHWMTNNILACALSIFYVEYVHISSFKTGAFLLTALFFYDIFWVFATDVMATVAMSLGGHGYPLLLQFPRELHRNGWIASMDCSMLGLGDIIIPGFFISLIRRFDQRVGDMYVKVPGAFGREEQKSRKPKRRFYFWITVVAYMAGLFITMAVMRHFKRGQPALLYLVPMCIITPLIVSLYRGEFTTLWNYSEDHLVEKENSSKQKKKN